MKKHTLCAGGPGLLHFSQVCVTENNLLAVFTAWCLGQNWPELAGWVILYRGVSALSTTWALIGWVMQYCSLIGQSLLLTQHDFYSAPQARALNIKKEGDFSD